MPPSFLTKGFTSRPPSFAYDDSVATMDFLESLLEDHGVAGVSVALLEGDTITSMCAGAANRARTSVAPYSAMKPSTWLQQASLSKTIGAAYMVTYYQVHAAPSAPP